MSISIILNIIIAIICLIILILLIKILSSKSSIDADEIIDELTEKQSDQFSKVQLELYKELSTLESRLKENAIENNDKIKDILNNSIKENIEDRVKSQDLINKGLMNNKQMISDGLLKIQENMERRLEENSKILNESLNANMDRVNKLTSEKLSEIQGNVNEKLDKSLNERLDENFKQVGDRLEALYKSLGEIKNLESGVITLNKTLSNVKSRGVYGEIQLGNLLANILDNSQYDVNVSTKPKSNDVVEFAIKIPSKEDKGDYIYLPIDAKFPTDIYAKISQASENADSDAIIVAQKELKNRILSEAKTIRDKYIYPPKTTDFAIMFLPTEGLYAEVLRIPGLAEACQEKFKIVISGPMNLTAMVNSLSIGFKYLTVNKKTDEIRKTLANFKAQFEKFDKLIEETQTSIDKARKKTDALNDRNRMIKDRLGKIEKFDTSDIVEIEDNTI